MQQAFGIFFVNILLMIFSVVIMVIGVLIFQKAENSAFRAIGGAFLIAVGGLAFLNSFYVEGFREYNDAAGVILVVVIGFVLIKDAPGFFTTAVGVVVLIVGVLSLGQTWPFDQIELSGGPVEAFKNGFNELREIFERSDDRPARD